MTDVPPTPSEIEPQPVDPPEPIAPPEIEPVEPGPDIGPGDPGPEIPMTPPDQAG